MSGEASVNGGAPRWAPEEVGFDSGGVRCAAWRFGGQGEDFAGGDGGRACVVMAHGFSGTRDSGLVPYAERFAAAGLDVLVFDYRHFGASDGEPRQLLSVARQHEDWHAAVRFARGLEGVDPERIVLWGSSYSGGHVVPVAADDGRVVAVVSQTPAMDGVAVFRRLLSYAGPALVARLVVAGVRDALRGLRGQEPLLVGAVGAPGTLAAMTTEEAEPGFRAIAGPTWRNEVSARTLLGIGAYRPGKRAAEMPCPWLIQIADRDSVAPGEAAAAAAWEAKGRAEVRWYPIQHFEVYVGEAFERAVGDQLHFLRRHLGVGREATTEGAATARR